MIGNTNIDHKGISLIGVNPYYPATRFGYIKGWKHWYCWAKNLLHFEKIEINNNYLQTFSTNVTCNRINIGLSIRWIYEI